MNQVLIVAVLAAFFAGALAWAVTRPAVNITCIAGKEKCRCYSIGQGKIEMDGGMWFIDCEIEK